MKENTTIGNIVFGEDGVFIQRKYDSYDASNAYFEQGLEERKKRKAEALECAMAYLQCRIDHCRTELENNFAKAVIVTPQEVVWDNGHFSLPVYRIMCDCIARNPKDWDELNIPELQQIVRALYFQRCSTPKFYAPKTCNKKSYK